MKELRVDLQSARQRAEGVEEALDTRIDKAGLLGEIPTVIGMVRALIASGYHIRGLLQFRVLVSSCHLYKHSTLSLELHKKPGLWKGTTENHQTGYKGGKTYR